MIHTQPASYYEARLSVFEDSAEIAEWHKDAFDFDAENGEYNYEAAETCDHILGLWEFAKECVAKIKEMERVANEQV